VKRGLTQEVFSSYVSPLFRQQRIFPADVEKNKRIYITEARHERGAMEKQHIAARICFAVSTISLKICLI